MKPFFMNRVKRVFEHSKVIFHFLLSQRCGACSDILTYDAKSFLCQPCDALLEASAEPFCAVCGDPFQHELLHQQVCLDCLQCLPSFEQCRSAYLLKAPLSGLIYELKYGNSLYALKWMNEALLKTFHVYYSSLALDAVISVPLHPFRLMKRSYNQSYLLAQNLSRSLNLPHLSNLVKRVHHEKSQTLLGKEERFKNIKGAFKINKIAPKSLQTILIIDDVFTTGATLEEISYTLKTMQPDLKIYGLTLGRTLRKGEK